MHPLDNPIWEALTTVQAHFAQGDHLARKFPSAITKLAAFQHMPSREAYDALAALASVEELAFLYLDAPPQPPASWTIVRSIPMLQFVHGNGKPAVRQMRNSALPEFLPLGAPDAAEMLALTELTRPGPFGTRTYELGTYLGIRVGGKLAAMAGERLRLTDYTEVSAVCTHPEFTGRGYAAALMTELMQRIYQRGETPMLHVRGDNVRAIELYKRLGFKERRVFQLGVLRRSSP